MPLISIITVTFNAEKVLERTIKSIENQRCKDFEYLIIDGKSSDRTLEIAQKYKKVVSKIISEEDQGIYDAMNKGLFHANGKFIWFMNAGDEIADQSTVCTLVDRLTPETDLLYGDAWFVNDMGDIRGKRSELTPHKLKPNLNWKDLRYGMLVCHQSLIVSKDIAPTYIKNNLSADVDFEINSFKNSENSLFLDFPISKYLEGGVSNQNLKRSLKDRYSVLKHHFGFFPNLFNHAIILARGLMKILLSKGKYW
jgi:glycosyltransferase involved in cell wall biosynthesis